MRTLRRRLLATGGLTLALGVTNIVAAPRLDRLPSATWNLGTTAIALSLARWAGLPRAAIGLDRHRLPDGVATGAVGAAAIAAALGMVASTRTGRELLDDDRVVDASWSKTALHVGVFIPLGTVVLEEVAFRGVLPALLAPAGRSVAATVVIPSLAFGAWHIVSSRDFVAAHDQELVGREPEDLQPVAAGGDRAHSARKLAREHALDRGAGRLARDRAQADLGEEGHLAQRRPLIAFRLVGNVRVGLSGGDVGLRRTGIGFALG